MKITVLKKNIKYRNKLYTEIGNYSKTFDKNSYKSKRKNNPVEKQTKERKIS